ncbi:ParB family protein [Pseudomonas asiatica]|uniref:ParB family protein n=1 Tax=Pseudomonas asiatica TaxID=2219225 RepID=A0ABU5KX84_9PSED|nr:ParB family protein [Pseudomonas asiatica]MDZ5738102.1 ParB family protein [Pseudomonas asiatica]MDZ5744698.1 ParB family protein [Pseudomonas asiatica]MDZ5748858.1 ParB family protein [Pseudomonas asiatica]MDZ5753190.1 ParB family protein [Pseudomonas asiatica]
MAAADIKAKLLAPGFTPTASATAMSDPISDTPMVLDIDDVLPWEDNPRTTRNPRYDEIKESIRNRNLDTPPPITRRPGEEKYRIRNGGNTRITILKELYQETKDPKFKRVNFLFRPWDHVRGDIIMLTGHLAEDLKGELKFIERAVGVGNAKALYEAESGEDVGIRELSRRLTKDGYPVSPSHISRMLDTLQYVLPAVPGLLYSGLGVDRITKIIALRKTSLACWEKHYKSQAVDFEMLFQDVLAQFEGDAGEFLFERFQDELIGTMKKSLPLGYEEILLEITQQQDKLRRSTPVVELPTNTPSNTPSSPATGPGNGGNTTPSPSPQANGDAGSSPQQERTPLQPNEPANIPSLTPEEQQQRITGHIASPANLSQRVLDTKAKVAALSGESLPDFNSNCLVAIPVQAGGLNPITDLWYIERQIDEPSELRNQVAQLAVEILESVNGPGDIQAIDGGIGFKYKQPETDVEVSATAQHTLTLLQSLSGAMAIALKMLNEQPDPAGALGEFEFAAGLGQLLLGQPQGAAQAPDDEGRLSDGALVKLFRIIRLARRLIDLEIEAFKRSSQDQDS